MASEAASCPTSSGAPGGRPDGSATGALLARLDQADGQREQALGLSRWRRPRAIKDRSSDAIGQRGWVDNEDGAPVARMEMSDASQQILARRVGLAGPAQRGAGEADVDRQAIGTERALQPGRVAQLADGDPDITVGLAGHRPGRQLGGSAMAGLVARWLQRGHR